MVAATAMLTMPALAQLTDEGKKQCQNIFYIHAQELIDQNDIRGAYEYFGKALQDDPNNVFALNEMARIEAANDMTSEALNHIAKVLSSGSKEYDMIGSAYLTRHQINLYSGNDEAALNDLKNCIEAYAKSPVQNQSGYFAMSNYYESKGNYDNMLACARKCIELRPVNINSHIAAARAYRLLKRLDDARAEINIAIYLSRGSSSAYAELATIAFSEGKYAEAAHNAVLSIEEAEDQDEHQKAEDLLGEIAKVKYDVADLYLASKCAEHPNQSTWFDTRANVQFNVKRYKESIDNYKKELDLVDNKLQTLAKLSNSYSQLGDQANALTYINQFIEQDTTLAYGYFMRAGINQDAAAPKEIVMADYDKAIKLSPRSSYYYSRAWYERYNGMKEEAVLDMTTAIQQNPEDPHYLLTRGNIYNELGEKEMAQDDYKSAIAIVDKLSEEHTETMFHDASYWQNQCTKAYALLYTGKKAEAEKLMQSYLDASDVTDRSGAYYNLACYYSLAGDAAKSLDMLRHSLDEGYVEFVHIGRDNDLDFVRKDPQFDALVAEYKKKLDDRLAKGSDDGKEATRSGSVSEIPFGRDGGVLTVPCSVNGLPLTFIFDSGAADVTLSLVEARFMLKNGYIKSTDLGDKQYFGTADGTLSVGTKVILRSITFGGETLTNVPASIVNTQAAPLLLGQTAMQRLGKVEIDYEKNVIRIKN